MALWQQFNSIGAPPGIQDDFHGVYSLPRDELVICLRVVFANWIEISIGKISPAAFVGALEFQIASALRKKRALPVDPRNLRHQSKLSSYQRLLQKYKAPEAVDELYRKFVHCLHEEYKVIRRNKMDNFIPTELYDLIESLQKDFGLVGNKQGQAGIAVDLSMQMQTISSHSCRFPNLLKELRSLVNDLMVSFARFNNSHQDFEAQKFIQVPREAFENEPHFNLLIIVSNELLDQAQQILWSKSKIEHKLREIHDVSSAFIGHLQTYLHWNEKLHGFRNRPTKINVEELGTQAEIALLFLKEICQVTSGVVDANRCNYLRILDISHEVMMTLLTIRAENERPELRIRNLYDTTEIYEMMQELEMLQWSIYRDCSLVMESQPPSVIIKGSPRPIAVRFFKLDNILPSHLTVKVYLVNENTVKDIRTSLSIPDRISRITTQKSRRSDSIAGDIVIADDSQSQSTNREPSTSRGQGQRGPRTRKRRTSDDSIDSLPSSAVVHLMQENVQNIKSCYFDKVLLVKTIKRSSKIVQSRLGKRRTKPSQNQPLGNKSSNSNSADVTNDKVALLFVTEIPFQNDIRKVWTISLPMIVAAHGSQNEKATATMAWDEVMCTPTRKGFEVDDTANWEQVSQMIKGTFENLVREPLKPHHLLYVKRKLEQYMGTPLKTHTPISKKNICVVSAHSFWLWFYRSISIIKTISPFHNAWKLGYIEGFINYEDATMILSKHSPQVQPGTFIVRFSDTLPGSLTIVFMGFDKRIYKMQPMDLFRKTALQDCATILLAQLNLKENVHKKDIFSHVYPNISKEDAFEIFYKWAAKQQTPSFQGYVVMSLFVPLSAPTSPMDSIGDDLNASPTSKNDTNGDNIGSLKTTECPSFTVPSLEHDQLFVNTNPSTSSRTQFHVGQEMETADDFYMNIQPSEIRNYSSITRMQ